MLCCRPRSRTPPFGASRQSGADQQAGHHRDPDDHRRGPTEELHVERLAAPAAAATNSTTGSESAGDPGPVLVMILHHEISEIVNRVVAVERVAVFIDEVSGAETVAAELRHEEVELVEDSRASTDHRASARLGRASGPGLWSRATGTNGSVTCRMRP